LSSIIFTDIAKQSKTFLPSSQIRALIGGFKTCSHITPYKWLTLQKARVLFGISRLNGGQDSLVDKALDYRPKGTEFDPRLDHKRRST
jgi:hypothetical protein